MQRRGKEPLALFSPVKESIKVLLLRDRSDNDYCSPEARVGERPHNWAKDRRSRIIRRSMVFCDFLVVSDRTSASIQLPQNGYVKWPELPFLRNQGCK